MLECIEQAPQQGPGYGAKAHGPAGRRAAELLDECRDLLHCGLEGLRTTWLWTNREVGELRRQLEGLAGGGKERRPWFGEPGRESLGRQPQAGAARV